MIDRNFVTALATVDLHKRADEGLRVQIRPATIRSRNTSIPSRTSKADCPDRIPFPEQRHTLTIC